MNAFVLRETVRVCLDILFTAACVAAPVAALEGLLVLVSFGQYAAWWWLLALSAGLLLGVAYQVIVAYNRTRSAEDPDNPWNGDLP